MGKAKSKEKQIKRLRWQQNNYLNNPAKLERIEKRIQSLKSLR